LANERKVNYAMIASFSMVWFGYFFPKNQLS
jgi:hypothetical protein